MHHGEYFGVEWFVEWSDVAGLSQEWLETLRTHEELRSVLCSRTGALYDELMLAFSYFFLVALWSR